MTFKNSGIKVMSFVLALAMALTLIPGLALAADLSPELQEAYDALVIHNADDIRESINLPSVGENGAAITWASSDETIVSTEEVENEGYFPTPAGVVTRPDRDTEVTLTATLTLDGETVEKVFDLKVKAAPEGDVSLMDANSSAEGAYLFYYFVNNGKAEQQIFLAASQDGLMWRELNNREPILTSTMGDQAVRDPYIIRSPEKDKFYLIATDLDASGGDWTGYQYNGSKDIVVWESTNLVDWSEQRMVTVSTSPDQGCTWAPEVTYDPVTNEYVVYWSSKIITDGDPYYRLNVVYYATTRDFETFGEPKRFIEGTLGMTGSVAPGAENYNQPITVIDTTILQSEDDGKFYRVTKHEGVNKVFMESSDHLLTGYTTVDSNLYTDPTFAGVEGPELYRLEDGRYCLLLDRFGNGGYMPVITNDLAGGQFETIKDRYKFPVARHGGVLRITDEEYDRVMAKYYKGAPAQTPDQPGSGPIITYNFDDGTAGDSVGDNDAELKGTATVVEDKQKGKVLSLDGSSGTYLELPQRAMDGRNELTVSMDVLNNTTGNYFNFALGRNSDFYLFSKLMNNGAKLAITTGSYSAEEAAERYTQNMNGVWKNITFTVSAAAKTMKVYIDGKPYAEVNNVFNTISDLGTGTLAYVGKSFYDGDAYANMKADNIEIYNRVLTDEEVAEKYAPTADDMKRYSVTVDAAQKGADITPGTVGLFFEDINYSADGGMYSEIVNNRSFEAYDVRDKLDNPAPIPGYGWDVVGSAEADYSSVGEPLNNNNKTYLTLTASAAGAGIENNCYAGDGTGNLPLGKGMNAVAGASYNASLYVRGGYDGEIKMQVVSGDAVIGEVAFDGVTEDFTKKSGVITVNEDCDDARVRVVLSKPGAVDLDMISLLPQQTFNGRDNGLRADLVERLAQLHPGFIRFPGGCIIEGYNLANRYQWKHTVGPVEQRTQNWNRWQTHNETHEGNGMYGYCQTYGLGYYEYFLLCEDLGAAAVPVLNVGLACQYQSKETSSKDDLYSIYIQDALDLIQFANGDPGEDWENIDYSQVDSTKPETFGNNWANLRALMGHPESFNMEYMGIGNEQFDTSDYSEGKVDNDGWADNGNNFFFRYEAFEKAIHDKYPEMKLISTSGPCSDDAGDSSGSAGAFSKAWNWVNEKIAAKPNFTYAVDEHYYKQPDWFLDNINRYDDYDRNGAAVFAGEYASRWWESLRGNTWEAALSEAAYMTGLEKNSDIVKMASYAPLFARQGAHQWSPDMIWFNNSTNYGTPDYYVQQIYSRNSGDYNLETELTDILKDDTNPHAGIAGVGTWETSATFKDFKITNDDTGEEILIEGWQDTAEGNFAKGGEWVVNEDGSATQTSTTAQGGTYLFADMDPITANNFTVTLRATKTGGNEGFTIPIMAKDNANLIHWNVGGWGNTTSSFERRTNGANEHVGDYVGTNLATGQEYELKIVAKNGTVYGYLDGQLINTYVFDEDYGKTTGPVYANAIRDESNTGDIILKLVNNSSVAYDIPIEVKNASTTGKATEYLLCGEDFYGKNDFDNPERISIERSEISIEGGYTLPAYSVAALRIHTDSTVAVSEIEPVELTTYVGSGAWLPDQVTVYTDDGDTQQRDVTWILPDAGVFANEGSFKVFGRVRGTELDAEALVTVVAKDEAAPAIDADVEAILKGQEANIVFNPAEPGAYRGIFAVYGEKGLESIQTVEFNGVRGSMTVKTDLTGKTAKIMLWSAEELAPATDAVFLDPAAKG